MNTPKISEKAVERLLAWYGESALPLPWRASRSPYHIWISEIMLQQTRTAAVIPYFERFIAELPTVEALAAVDEARLLKLWEGLGYYSRARNLKKAAEIIVGEHGGSFPQSAEALRKLPGIGDYTAGAIASIAFGEPEPAVDGNVLRVLMRFLNCEDDIMLGATKKKVTAWLRPIYPQGRDAGRLTEALMELGENVCIPNGAPRCLDCPLAELCAGLSEGSMLRLPIKAPKKPRRIEERTILVLHSGDRYALSKRPPKGLLASLWEFPSSEGRLTARQALEKARALSACPVSAVDFGDAVHIFTHIEWHMQGYFIECDALPETLTSATAEEILNIYALPKAFRVFVDAIMKKESEEHEKTVDI